MIYLNKQVQKKVNSIKYDNLYIVTDFDRTITVGSSSTWSILSKNNLMPKEYIDERQKLYDYYRPIEIDNNLDFETKNKLMSEWWNKHISLLVKYQISEEVIKSATKDLRVMDFRTGAKKFLEKMYIKKVPVIIISAGIGNFIQQFLSQNNCNFNNIYIVANFVKFENGIATGVSENIIHSLNKNEISLPKNVLHKIIGRKKIILLGDALSDINMVSSDKRDDTIRIGFLEEQVEENLENFKQEFDIVCTDKTSYDELSEVLIKLKRKL